MLVMRNSRPSSRILSCSWYCARSFWEIPERRVRWFPLLDANARFSSICILAAVPVMGSWKTRPRYLARLYSGSLVTSIPSIVMFPSSTEKTPATALSMVDFPAPFPPITVTKSPSSSLRDKPFSAVFSLIVPALNVFVIPDILSTGSTSFFCRLIEVLSL